MNVPQLWLWAFLCMVLHAGSAGSLADIPPPDWVEAAAIQLNLKATSAIGYEGGTHDFVVSDQKIKEVTVGYKDAIDGIKLAFTDGTYQTLGSLTGKHGSDLTIDSFSLDANVHLVSIDIGIGSVSDHMVLDGITFHTDDGSAPRHYGKATSRSLAAGPGKEVAGFWSSRGTYLDSLGIYTKSLAPLPTVAEATDSGTTNVVERDRYLGNWRAVSFRYIADVDADEDQGTNSISGTMHVRGDGPRLHIRMSMQFTGAFGVDGVSIYPDGHEVGPHWSEVRGELSIDSVERKVSAGPVFEFRHDLTYKLSSLAKTLNDYTSTSKAFFSDDSTAILSFSLPNSRSRCEAKFKKIQEIAPELAQSREKDISLDSLKLLITFRYHTTNTDFEHSDLARIQKGMFSEDSKLLLTLSPDDSTMPLQLSRMITNQWAEGPVYTNRNSVTLVATDYKIRNEQFVQGGDGGRDWEETIVFTGLVGSLGKLRKPSDWQNAIADITLTATPDPAWWGAFVVSPPYTDLLFVANYEKPQLIQSNVFSTFYKLPRLDDFKYFYLYALRQRMSLQMYLDGDSLLTTSAYPAYFAAGKNSSSPTSTRLVAKFALNKIRFPSFSESANSVQTVALTCGQALADKLGGASSASLNGQPAEVITQASGTCELRFLGGETYVENGLNALKTKFGQFLTYWDGRKLEAFNNPYSTSFAIVVAIDDYERKNDPKKRRKTGYSGLTKMVSEAENLVRALRALDFPETNIFRLYNSEATSSKIDQLLKEFYQGGTYSRADRLFFYFGGHGDTNNQGHFLITYDYDPLRPTTTTLLTETLTDQHFKFVSAKHMLAAIDACGAGLADPTFLGPPSSAREQTHATLELISAEASDRARDILLATTGEQAAVYKDGGIFTKALIDGLKGAADYDKNGIIRFPNLGDYVWKTVVTDPSNRDQAQHPDYRQIRRFGHGNVVFLLPR